MIINYDALWLKNMHIVLIQVYTELGNLIQHDLHQYHISNNNLLIYSLEMIHFSIPDRKLAISLIYLSAWKRGLNL